MTWTKALHLKVPVKAHWAGNRDWPLVALVALAGTSISATSNALSSFLGGLIPGRELGDAWAAFWLANAVGVLLIAPLLLLWSRGPLPKPRPARIAEAAAIITSLVIASGIAFGGWHTGSFRTVAVSCLAAMGGRRR